MKVLFLTQPYPDYAGDLLFHGMVTLLGPEATHHYPRKLSWCGDASLVHDSHAHCFFPYGAMGAQEQEPSFGRYDLVIAHASWQLLAGLDPEREALCRKAAGETCLFFLDGQDATTLYQPALVWADRYLKREYRASHAEDARLVPCPLAAIATAEPDWDAPRPFRLVFWGTDTGGERQGYVNALQRLQRADVAAGLTKRPHWPISYGEHAVYLQSAQMGLSLPGAGADTSRYWEIPARGACLIAPITPQVIPYDFEDGVHAIRFQDYEDFWRRFSRLEEDSSGLRALAQAGYHHFRRFHTTERRAAQVLTLAGWEEDRDVF